MKKGMVLPVTGLIMTLIFAFMLFPREETKGVRINRLENNAGRRVAICIGINDYEDNTVIKLKKARNDARELGKVLRSYGQFDQVYVMTDDLNPRDEFYPKLNNIKRKMAFLKGLLDPQDLVVFSFSGHGISNSQGEGFLLTADSYADDLYGSSLKVSDIIQWLKETNVKKSLLLLDACREHVREGRAVNLNGLKAERFSHAEVGAVFYSTRSGWFSYEDKNGDFGVFTRFVIEGLMGKADSKTGNNDGIVSFSELSSFVDEEVSGWALKEGKKQRPFIRFLGEKYGELALSAYIKTDNKEKKEEERKINRGIAEDKPASVIADENKKKEERIKKETPEDSPEDLTAVESKDLMKYKNDKGFWEANFGEGIIMVYIPAGEFTMGQTEEEKKWLIAQTGKAMYDVSYKVERPLHKVYLDGYWLGKTEVTVKQFSTFVNETQFVTVAEKGDGAFTWIGSKWKKEIGINWRNPGFKQEDKHPVVCISQNDAVEYCKWLSKKTGFIFTLPTEAQWEKGARGTDGRKYPWGNHEPYDNGEWYANYNAHNNWKKMGEDGYKYTSPVGSYPQGASPYGLLDMAGNAWEWCADWYDVNYYSQPSKKNPKGPPSGTYCVIRGGSCYYRARFLRCANRSGVKPFGTSSHEGFRVALSQLK